MRFYTSLLALAFCAPLFGEPSAQSSVVSFAELTKAIRADDLSSLKQLAGNSASVHVTDNLHWTLLHYAALYGSAGAVRMLLAAGADPNARNVGDATPLLYAAWDQARVRALVEAGAEVNAADKNGVTPLQVASSLQGNIETVRYLLDHHADPLALDRFGDDALMRAAGQGDTAVVSLLLNRKADAHVIDRWGFTALQNSLQSSDPARVHLLLAAGADPNLSNNSGGMVRKGPINLIHITSLMLAAPYADGATVAELLRAGARVSDSDNRKMTPLMFSIGTDQARPSVVKSLIAAGADVNATDSVGDSVLTWARKFNHPEIVSALLAAGAKAPDLPSVPQPAPGSQPVDAKAAVLRALPLLASSGTQFFAESGCAGCHHQPLQARAYAAVTHASLTADAKLRANLLASVVAARPFTMRGLAVLQGGGGDFDPLLSYSAALADLHEPANPDTDLMLHYIAARQDQSGTWLLGGIARPPIEDSSITRTALAVRALRTYSWPARKTEFDARTERARVWLEMAKPITTYECADKLTGLNIAGSARSLIQQETRSLIQLQRASGGWAQTPYLEPDAYATGMALHALHTTANMPVSDPVYQRGVAFLLHTQFADGSWYVRSRAPKFQPYFQSGFPFEHDQWISSSGTAYAVMALAPAISASND